MNSGTQAKKNVSESDTLSSNLSLERKRILACLNSRGIGSFLILFSKSLPHKTVANEEIRLRFNVISLHATSAVGREGVEVFHFWGPMTTTAKDIPPALLLPE